MTYKKFNDSSKFALFSATRGLYWNGEKRTVNILESHRGESAGHRRKRVRF
jgi:hypothetical protein